MIDRELLARQVANKVRHDPRSTTPREIADAVISLVAAAVVDDMYTSSDVDSITAYLREHTGKGKQDCAIMADMFLGGTKQGLRERWGLG